jgi:Cdc6-like AAA superfamily ATPase
VTSFVQNPNSAINGMIVSGDAGTGKTHTVKQALRNTGHQKNTEYIKGTKLTAASLYVKLYLNRLPHRICVFDDCDLIHRTGSEKRDILDMIKGATEPSSRPRQISWERAQRNPLMIALDVPMSFEYDGTVIWITNDTMVDIKKAAKQHYDALVSRFNIIKCYFNVSFNQC